MKSRIFRVLICNAWIFATAGMALACDGMWVNDIRRTTQMVSGADLILRVTAVDYSVPPDPSAKRSAPSKSRVLFSVEEVVKGRYTDPEIVLTGILTQIDEWNTGQAPYVNPRPSADASCYSNSYRSGGQFLLMLKRSGKDYSVEWFPLGPVNEQVHPLEDPWVIWVRNQIKRGPA